MSEVPRTTPARSFPPVRSLLVVWFAAAALVVAVLPAVTSVVPTTTPLGAVAAASSSCDGVTVRIERSGATANGCAPGAPRNGLFALSGAGFSYTEVPGQSGMVCTIEGYPRGCDGTPPADAYWSYWHADAGATSWTYANRGAGNRTPPPGSHEAWVFGAGSPPSSPPPAAAPPSGGSAGSGSEGSGSGSSGSGSSGSGSSGSGSSGSGSSGSGSSGSGSSGSGSGSSGGSGGAAGTGATAGSSSNGSSSNGSSGSGGSGGSASGSSGTGGGSSTPGGTDGASSQADPVDRPGPVDEPATDTEERDPDADEATAADERPAPERDEDALLAQPEAMPGARDDAVEITAPSGGRSAGSVALGSALVLGLAAAGVLRARRRGDGLGLEA